jgi:cell wall-associated NlpC family hydrolase
MKYFLPSLFIALFALMVGFRPKGSEKNVITEKTQVVDSAATTVSTTNDTVSPSNEIVSTSNQVTTPAAGDQASSFVEYAKTLIGTPYLYGSVDPGKGLDCSGFVNCVSDHFGIKVPRSSVDFTNFGTTVDVSNSKPGDLILFTGTNANRRVVGHMGIVTENENGVVQFIHSSSGKAKGVTLSELDGYYQTRFMKVVRIFPATSNTNA